MSRKTLIIVPGFLTEPHSLARQEQDSAMSCLDPSAVLDRRAWLVVMNQLCHEDIEVINFPWASQSLIELLWSTLGPILGRSRQLSFEFIKSQLLKSAGGIHDAWTQAHQECDAQVPHLHRLIVEKSSVSDVYVLGHSLGARLALKTLNDQAVTSKPLNCRLSAWAPAISQKDLDWSFLAQQRFIPEIAYSQADLVLKLIYPLGQAPRPSGHILDILNLSASLLNQDERKKAVGYIGPPHSTPAVKQFSHDLSLQAVSHLAYLPAAGHLFRSSRYLKDLLPSS
ncbi:MAG: hypothetical protein CMH49_04980 [Myxococcales bacterium]|nr:hypothetical protein [Myxococcales bacterium]